MAGVSVDGGKKARRSLDSEINMIPMIDLLMVTVSFLLITAVWSQYARMEATAKAPSATAPTPPCEGDECKEESTLHVMAGDPQKFVLAWKQGRTVIRSIDIPREGKNPYETLGARVDEEWKASGMHRDAQDRRFDRAVLHTNNEQRYGEIVAMMDAIAKPKRTTTSGGKTVLTSAFMLTMAAD